MKLGVRGKLFLVSVGLVAAVVLSTGLYLRGELRALLESRIEAELLRHARTVETIIETIPSVGSIAEVDPLCDRLGAATGTRITVIQSDGSVLCDSQLTPEETANIENHGSRPEVIEALARGRGTSRRWSTTIKTHMLYVAVPFERDGNRGVVRTAEPLEAVDQALARLRVLLLIAGLVGLVFAIAISGLASHFMSRTLRSLVDNARAIARGQQRRRLDVTSDDELAGLAGSLNQMAEDIEATVAALALERARFGNVLEGLGEAVIAIDSERAVTLMNLAARDMLGVTAPPEGTPILELLRAPALQSLIGEPTSSGSAEFDLPGTTRRVLATIAPLGDEAGAVLIMRDVTEIRRLETIRRDFVANVSHELRTPVSVIRANTETLLDGAMGDPVHGERLLSAAHRNAERLSNIIADLLDLSQLEAGRHHIETIAIDVAGVVARAVDSVGHAAAERDTRIDVVIGDAVTAHADAKALEQVLVNYLENAIKYTPKHGHIEVTARLVDGRARIEVRDDGPGIEARHRKRVFERFYRVDPGRSRDMGGTGLGLSIVKHLAEAMDGTVGASPNEPRGTIFWIELPSTA